MGLPLPAVPAGTRATLLAASTLTVMAGAIVAAGTPGIAAHFAADPAAGLKAKLLLSLPGLAIALVSPFAGTLADRLGRKPVLVAGLLLYAAAGSTGLYLEDLDLLLAGRLLLGAAVALLMTAATALIGDLFAGAERGKFLGFQASAMSLGGVVLVPLGGVLAGLGWHAPFAVYLVAVPMLLMAVYWVHEPDRVAPATDPAAADGTIPWAVVLMLYAVGFVGMSAFALAPVQVPFLMKDRFDAGPTRAALVVAAATLMSACVALSYGRIAKRVRPGWLLVCVFAGVGIGYAIAGTAAGEPGTWFGFVFTGLGSGLLLPTLSSWLARVSPPAVRGRLTGGLMSSIFLGQFVSPVAAEPVVRELGYAGMFAAVGGGLLVIGAGAAAANLIRWRS